MRATSGKSLFTETLYVAQIIRYVIVYGIASEPTLYRPSIDLISIRYRPYIDPMAILYRPYIGNMSARI